MYQIDFDSGGSCEIPFAEQDTRAMAAWLQESLADIDEIIVTLDSHHVSIPAWEQAMDGHFIVCAVKAHDLYPLSHRNIVSPVKSDVFSFLNFRPFMNQCMLLV